jgi:hypothetical protein
MVYHRVDDVAVTRLDATCDVPAWRRGTQPITSSPAAPGTSFSTSTISLYIKPSLEHRQPLLHAARVTRNQ